MPWLSTEACVEFFVSSIHRSVVPAEMFALRSLVQSSKNL
jgi:hypothetical protein